MPGELHGRLVLLKVDTDGMGTFAALSREISCTYRQEGDVQQAVNKGATAAAGADYALGARYSVTGSGHVAAASLDTALDKLEDAFRAQTKIDVQMVIPAPFDTYEGSLVVSSFEWTAGGDDFMVVNFEGQFDGQPTKTTTS